MKNRGSSEPESGTVTFKEYTVAAGDSIYRICQANNIDFGVYYKTILAINGIEENQLYAGQKILITVTE